MNSKIVLFMGLYTVATSYDGFAQCSNKVIDDFKKASTITVYKAENIEILSESKSVVEKLLVVSDSPKPYPEINETQNCLVSYSFYAAPPLTCTKTFAKAAEFSVLVKEGETRYGVSDTYPEGFAIPEDILKYYRSFSSPSPSNGGYFGLASELILTKEPIAPEKTVKVTGGYEDFFGSMVSIAEKCKKDAGVPVHKPTNFNPESRAGHAIVDVYKSGNLSCSFIANIVDSKIQIKVPSDYKNCVKASDLIITRIETIGSNGELETKTVADDSEKFINTKINGNPRVVASIENNTKVTALMDLLDLGIKGENFTQSAMVNISDINFNDVSSLDPVIFKIVALCEWGISPTNYDEEMVAYMANWNDMEGDVLSAVNGKKGGYYRAMYYHQLQSSKTFPQLRKLHADIKQGIITNENLSNWENNALAVCYMNYPIDWNPVYIMDYIKDGVLDDRSTIPLWSSGLTLTK